MASKRLALIVLMGIAAATLALASGATEGTAAAGEKVTLTYFIGEHPNSPMKGDSPVLQAIAKKTGVTIDFQAVPNGPQETEKRNIILASGEYPDFISGNITLINEYAEKVFVALEPLMDKVGPNLKKLMTPETRIMVLNSEGKIYGVPRMGNPEHMLGWLVRKDWLDKGKITPPKTLDDWVKVLKIFKDGDFDGNGKADTIPLSSRGWPIYALVGPAYGLHPDAYGTMWQPDGANVKFVLDSPAYKEMLAWINGLSQQGLLDKEFTVLKTPDWEQRVANSIIGASTDYVIRADMCNATGKKINPAFDMWVADIAAGPRGERGMRVYTSTMPNYSVGITKSSKYPEAAMRWLDFVYSDEGAELFSWGIKGVSYDMVNGKRTYLGDYAKFDGALMAQMTLRPNLFVHRIEKESTDYAYDVAYPVGNDGYKRSAAYKVYPLPTLVYTKDEQDVLKDWNANAAPLIAQYRDGIAVAQRPVSDWDELVTKLKGLGYDKYQAVVTAAYKRWYALKSK